MTRYYGNSWTMGPHTVEELERRRHSPTTAAYVMGVHLGYVSPDHPQRLVDDQADDWGGESESFADGFLDGVCWHEQFVGEVP